VRDDGAADRIGGRDATFHRAVGEAFARFADAEPERFRLIDASGSVEVVGARLFGALADMLP
jgi:dTMP kinase